MKPTKFIFLTITMVGLLGVVIWLSSYLTVANADIAPVSAYALPSKALFDEEHLKASYSSYPGIDIMTIITDKPTHQMSIHYPEFHEEKLNQVIDDYVTSTKAEFFEGIEHNKQLTEDMQATLYLLFEIHPIKENIYSIVFSHESYIGGANGRQSSKIFIVDLNENQFISQTDILKDSQQNREKIYHILTERFEQSEQYQDFFFEDQLKDWIDNEELTFSNVYLTEQDLIFKFDKYMVTAGAAGSPEILLPLDEIGELLTDEWLKKLNIEVKEPVPERDDESEVKEDDERVEEIKKETNKKTVALTFDDGPHPTHTIEILRLLDQYKAKATFFVLGNRVDFYPEIVQNMSDQGHEVGNHTWSHKDLTTLGQKEIAREIEAASQAIEKVIGKTPTYFRPPYGAINDQVRSATNLIPLLWTVDPKDWESRDTDKIYNHVKRHVRDGSIILMHDIYGSTVEAVELILDFLVKENYQIVTVSELNS